MKEKAIDIFYGFFEDSALSGACLQREGIC